ncbi:hypothetical protein TTRE_0000545801 [Trichuris trichiura]|uniref:Uncharacterized protein n=1 Tax=Trichuris trichiura TaxID=36087 RepID=A0A077ZCD0_TRITR|nr:hypothetical protein TTRE_0000545801 [Trichuris trichiura]
MSAGHSSPTMEHGKGRHAEYFLETFPTATSFMVRTNDISAVSDRDSLDIATLVEMNPKEFVERLTRIRDNKRNVLEAMGKLKNKFEGDRYTLSGQIDKSKLQRLVSLYDDLKKQEDEYLCIFRSVFPGKHGSTDSLPGATAAGSGATSSPTGSTGSRKASCSFKATSGDLIEQQNLKKSSWCPNVAMTGSSDSAFFELQEAQDALVKMLDQHRTMQGLDVNKSVEQVQQRQQQEFTKADLNKQREKLLAKQVELERLKSKLESFKMLCSQSSGAMADQSNGDGPGDVDDEEFVQERLNLLREKKQHMEGLLRELHRFEEDIGQAIAPQLCLPTASPSSVNSLLGNELRVVDESATSGKLTQNTSDSVASDNEHEAKRHLENQIQSHMQTIQKLKEEQGRLVAMKNQLLMLNSAAEQQQAAYVEGLAAPNSRSLKQMGNFQPSAFGGMQESLARRRPVFVSSNNSSAGISDDDDSFDHVEDLQEPDQAVVVRNAGQKVAPAAFASSGYRRNNGVEEVGDLMGIRRAKKQKDNVAEAVHQHSFKSAGDAVGRKGSLTNFGTSTVEQQYQQLQQHIDSIRAIFKEVALIGAAADESPPNRQQCDNSLCSGHRNSMCCFNSQQQAVMLAVLTCQQQIQLQQMELASLRNWCHSTYGEGKDSSVLLLTTCNHSAVRPSRLDREEVEEAFHGRRRPPLWSNSHQKSAECRLPTGQEAYYNEAVFESPCTSFEESTNCRKRGSIEANERRGSKGRSGPANESIGGDPAFREEQGRSKDGIFFSDASTVGQFLSANEEVRQEMATLMELNKQRPEYLVQLLRQLQSLSMEQLETAGNDSKDGMKSEMRPVESGSRDNIAKKSAPLLQPLITASSEELRAVTPPQKLPTENYQSLNLSPRRQSLNVQDFLPLQQVEKNVVEKTKLIIEDVDRIMRTEFSNWESCFLDENALLMLRYALLLKLKECLFNDESGSLFLVKVSDELHPLLYAFIDRSFSECWPELRSNLETLLIRQLDTALRKPLDSSSVEALTKIGQGDSIGELVEHCAHLAPVEESLACQRDLCLDGDSAKACGNFLPMKIAFIDDLPSEDSAIRSEQSQATRDSSTDGASSLNSMEMVNAENCSDSVRFIENDKQEYSSVTVDYKAVHANRVKCVNTVTVHVPNDRERSGTRKATALAVDVPSSGKANDGRSSSQALIISEKLTAAPFRSDLSSRKLLLRKLNFLYCNLIG